jgi:hypothetical protein
MSDKPGLPIILRGFAGAMKSHARTFSFMLGPRDQKRNGEYFSRDSNIATHSTAIPM